MQRMRFLLLEAFQFLLPSSHAVFQEVLMNHMQVGFGCMQLNSTVCVDCRNEMLNYHMLSIQCFIVFLQLHLLFLVRQKSWLIHRLGRFAKISISLIAKC